MQLAVEESLVPVTGSTDVPSGAPMKTPRELATIVSLFAASDGWVERVRLRADQRWYERLYQGSDYDIWVLSWMPGQSTGFHDHGESAGAFVVATGVLEEHRPGEQPVLISPGNPRAFGSDYAHDVCNLSRAPAVSIHAYSPPLTDMNEYELEGDRLVPRVSTSPRTEDLHAEWRMQNPQHAGRPAPLSIIEVLSAARARLRRFSPHDAMEAVATAGAILVDIRPERHRAFEGTIPGALIVERNVLEWRFDPTSDARLKIATDHDLQVIVFCSEGYTSSLAAAALQEVGLWRATDVVGGFHAWSAAGLPNTQPMR